MTTTHNTEELQGELLAGAFLMATGGRVEWVKARLRLRGDGILPTWRQLPEMPAENECVMKEVVRRNIGAKVTFRGDPVSQPTELFGLRKISSTR